MIKHPYWIAYVCSNFETVEPTAEEDDFEVDGADMVFTDPPYNTGMTWESQWCDTLMS